MKLYSHLKSNTFNKKIIPGCIAVILGLAIWITGNTTPAQADISAASSLCGNGASPDYGFTYDLRQPHWTVGWQGNISENTVNEVDTFLDKLNNDNVAQTMILILPEDEVGNRVNCAVHFLRYMQLGQPDGPRKDNGFTFLVVVEHNDIDVHYGVGLGLPALTASELTNLNRLAEDAYSSTGSLDEAVLSLIKGYYQVSRANYPPLVIPTATPEAINITLPEGNAGIAVMCCLLCVVALVVMFILWLFIRLARSGINIDFPDTGSSWNGGGGGWSRPSGGGGGWGGGSSGGGGVSRGGSGSGRSGRGN